MLKPDDATPVRSSSCLRSISKVLTELIGRRVCKMGIYSMLKPANATLVQLFVDFAAHE